MSSFLEGNPKNQSLLLSLIFITFMFLWSMVISTEPLYDFDMLAYMGVMVEMEEKDGHKIHQRVYSELEKKVSPSTFRAIIGSNDTRIKCFNDAKFFQQYLSFYRVKPLFTTLAYGIYRLFDTTLIEALLWVSIISFNGLGLLFFFWIKRHLTSVSALFVSILTMMLSPIANLARDPIPDGLSAFLILCAFYAFCYCKREWVLAFIILAVLARIDNFILGGVIGGMFFLGLPSDKKSKIWGFIIASIGGLLFLSMPHLVGNTSDWMSKFSHTFSIHQYLSEWIFSINTFRYSHFQLLLIFCIILFPLSKFLDNLHLVVILIIVVTMIIRLLLFPSFQDRFFVAFELVLLIVLASVVKRWKGWIGVRVKT